MAENKIKKGDFIQINYTGRVKDGNSVFDTTDENVAHAEGLEHHHGQMKPVTICVGEGHLLPALDGRLEGASLGKHTFEVKVEEAFGKKDAKLMRLIPMKMFHKEKINPVPGLPITVDDQQGVVRAVSGGRVIVDFNHPLAGQDLVYEIDAIKEVTDKKEQVEAVLGVRQFPFKSASVADNKAEVTIQFDLPEEIGNAISEEVKKCVKLDSVTFKTELPEKHEHDSAKGEKKHETDEHSHGHEGHSHS